MSRILGRIVGLIILLLLNLQSLTAGESRAGSISWRRDYAAARRESTKSGRDVLILFTSANCGWCRRLESSTLRDRSIVRLIDDQFIPVRIEETDPSAEAIFSSFSVEALPTFIVITSAGAIAVKQEGYLDSSSLSAILKRRVADRAPNSPASRKPSARRDSDK
jgi:thioredoxin-related protein